MRYFIYNREGVKVAPLQNITSIQWMPRYYERGTAEIHVRPTADNKKYLKKWFRIVCQERKEILFVEYVDRSDDPKKDIVIRGHLDNLGGVVNLYTTTIDNIETGLREMVTKNKRGREIRLSTSAGLTARYNPPIETTYGDLAEDLAEHCQRAGIGWKMVAEGGQLNVLKIYAGAVKNRARFSDQLGNVIAQEYLENLLNYRNTAYVYGEGDGEERKHITVIKKRNQNEPTLEMYVDARDLQSSKQNEDGSESTISTAEYMEQLRERGLDKLAETAQEALVYTCEINPDNPLAKLGTDYDLGDVVPVLSTEFGVYTYARVVGLNITEEQNVDSSTALVLNLEYQEELS